MDWFSCSFYKFMQGIINNTLTPNSRIPNFFPLKLNTKQIQLKVVFFKKNTVAKHISKIFLIQEVNGDANFPQPWKTSNMIKNQ